MAARKTTTGKTAKGASKAIPKKPPVKSRKGVGGSKTKYTKELFEKTKILATRGATDKEIYKTLSISHDSYYNYLKKYPEYSEMIKEARDVPIDQVEAALFKTAIGYEFMELHREGVPDKDGNMKTKIVKEVKKVVQPNVAAMIFYLTNKRGDKWVNTRRNEHTGKEGKELIPVIIQTAD